MKNSALFSLHFFFQKRQICNQRNPILSLHQWRRDFNEMYTSCDFNNMNGRFPSSFVLHIIISFQCAFYIHIARNVVAPFFITLDGQAKSYSLALSLPSNVAIFVHYLLRKISSHNRTVTAKSDIYASVPT